MPILVPFSTSSPKKYKESQIDGVGAQELPLSLLFSHGKGDKQGAGRRKRTESHVAQKNAVAEVSMVSKVSFGSLNSFSTEEAGLSMPLPQP